MKTFKKGLAVLLTLMFMLSVFPDALAQEIAEAEPPVRITVVSDKESYNPLETAKFTVKVENIGDEELTGVSVAADSDRFLLQKVSFSTLDVGTLAPGENREYSFYTVGSSCDSSFCILYRIILFVKNLICRPAKFEKPEFSPVTYKHTDAERTVSLGGSDATVSAVCRWNRFAPGSVTVTFDTGDGEPVDAITVERGEAAGRLPETTLEGYAFAGWYKDTDYNVPFAEDTVVEDDITVHALFIETGDGCEIKPAEKFDNDCPYDQKVTVISEEAITNENLSDYIVISDGYGGTPQVRVTAKDNNEYEIAPVSGYEPGWEYSFRSTGLTRFKGMGDNIYRYSFRVHKDRKMTTDKKDGIINLDYYGLTQFPSKNGWLIPAQDLDEKGIKAGDTICIENCPVEETENEEEYSDKSGCVYLKVKEIQANGIEEADGEKRGAYMLICEDAEVSDVYDNVDVYFEENLDNDLFTDADEEEIAAQLRNSESLNQVNTMMAVCMLSSPTFVEMAEEPLGLTTASVVDDPDFTGNAYINSTNLQNLVNRIDDLLTIVVNVGPTGKVTNKNFSEPASDNWMGIEFTYKYEGTLGRSLRTQATFTFKQYLNLSMQGYSSVKFKFSDEDHLKYDFAVNCYSQTTIGLNILVGTNGGIELNDITDEVIRIINGKDADTDSLVEQMATMLDSGVGYIDFIRIKIYSKSRPINQFLQVNMNLDFLVRINLAAGIGAEYTVLDATQIGFRGDTSTDTYSSYRNTLSESGRYDLKVTACGFLGVRAGLEGSLTVSFIGLRKLGEVGAGIGFGVYIETYGYAQYRILQAKTDGTPVTSLKGGYYSEFGLYVDVALFARSISFKKEISATLLDMKFPLMSWGSKLVLMGLEVPGGPIVLTNDFTPIDNINITGKYVDITTGKIITGRKVEGKDITITFSNGNFKTEYDSKYKEVTGISHTQSVWYSDDRFNVHAEQTSAEIRNNCAKMPGAGDILNITIAWTDGKYIKTEDAGKQYHVVIYDITDGVQTKAADRMMNAGSLAASFAEFSVVNDMEDGMITSWDTDPRYTIVDRDLTFTRTRMHPQRKVAYLYADETGESWAAEVRVLDGNESPSLEIPGIPGTKHFSSWRPELGEGDKGYVTRENLSQDFQTYIQLNGTKRIFCGFDKNAELLKLTASGEEEIRRKLREEYPQLWDELAYVYTAEYVYGPAKIRVKCLDSAGNEQILEGEWSVGKPADIKIGIPEGKQFAYYVNETKNELSYDINYPNWRNLYPDRDMTIQAYYVSSNIDVTVQYYDAGTDSWKTVTLTAEKGRIDRSAIRALEEGATASTERNTDVKWLYTYNGYAYYQYGYGTVFTESVTLKMVLDTSVDVSLDYDGDGTADEVLHQNRSSGDTVLLPQLTVPEYDPMIYNIYFEGWEDKETEQIYSCGSCSFSKNILLTAKWHREVFPYTVRVSRRFAQFEDGKTTREYTVNGDGLDAFVDGLKAEYKNAAYPDYNEGYYTWHFTGNILTGEKIKSDESGYLLPVTLEWTSTVSEYTVTLVYGNGTPDSTQTCHYGDGIYAGIPDGKVKAPDENYTYTYGGWDTDGDGEADIMPGEQYYVHGSATLSAVWVPHNRYTVTLIYDNGTPDSVNKYTYGEKFNLGTRYEIFKAEDEKASRYYYGGWDTDGDGIADLADGADYTVTGNATLRLIWDADYKSYTVTYFVDGVQNGAVQTCRVCDKVTLRDKYTVSGYTVSDWTTEDAAIVNGTFEMPAKNVNLYAETSPNTYNITYKVDGSTWKTSSAACGSKVTVPIPDAPGNDMMFTGWKADDDRLITSAFTIGPRDITLSAVFTERPQKMITLLYYIDGNVYKKADVSPGEIIDLSGPGSKTVNGVAMAFSGWGSDSYNLTDGFSFGENDGPVVNLYGTYTPADNPVKVTLTLGSGEAARTFWTLNLDRNEEYTLPVYGSVTGWTGEGISGNVLTVPAGTDSLEVTASVSGRVHLASYKLIRYAGKGYFDINGGEYHSTSKAVTAGEKEYLPEVTDAGEAVTGWVSVEGVEIFNDSNGSYFIVPDYDVCFCFVNLSPTAEPAVKLYLEIPGDDPDRPGETVLMAGTSTVDLPILTFKGYSFDGWFRNGERVNVNGSNPSGEYYCRFKQKKLILGRYYVDGAPFCAEVFHDVDGWLELYQAPEIGSCPRGYELENDWNSHDVYCGGGILPETDLSKTGQFICFRNTCSGDTYVTIDTSTDPENCTGADIWEFNASPGDTFYFPVYTGTEGQELTCEWRIYDSHYGYEVIGYPTIPLTEENGFYSFTVPECSQADAVLYITFAIPENATAVII